ncbi:MAG: PhzF family phenazine biosynthesis protein [Pseudomonadota bacterium]
MDIERISAFSVGEDGGNPAGVVIGDAHPEATDMARIAAEVGYSETAFAARMGEAWRVRYFAPASEVPFCGHATIALGAALGGRFGVGVYDLILNDARISVEAMAGARAALTSPPTSQPELDPALTTEARRIFGVADEDLHPDLPIARISAGADMLMIPLSSRARLARMEYDQAAGKALLDAHGIIGAYFVHQAEARRFDVRMAFPTGGVFEDPATGAAAAAFSGWLRDSGRLSGVIEIMQGEDMGAPSRITARSTPDIGAPIRVEGATRRIRCEPR